MVLFTYDIQPLSLSLVGSFPFRLGVGSISWTTRLSLHATEGHRSVRDDDGITGA